MYAGRYSLSTNFYLYWDDVPERFTLKAKRCKKVNWILAMLERKCSLVNKKPLSRRAMASKVMPEAYRTLERTSRALKC